MNQSTRIAMAEAVGTFILIIGGPGTAILATGGFAGASSTVGILGVALAFGLGLLCAAYAIGSISGCHINPAVTLGLWAIKKTNTEDVPFYLGGQLVGGVLGALVIFVIANSQSSFDASKGFASNGYDKLSPGGFGIGPVILVEIVFTALFIFVIASTSRRSMPAGFTGIAMGLMLTLIHLVTIPVDNTSVNPARSIATAVFQGGDALSQLWVFIVFPIVGGVLGALIWRTLVPAEDV
jgi:aquaporin Z